MLLLVGMAALGGVVTLLALSTDGRDPAWWKWLEPVTGVLTLAVAGAVWWGELKQDHDASIPKKLTVRFFNGGVEVMRCERAYLADEADIRAWAQQLGRQMNDNKDLSYFPDLRVTLPRQPTPDSDGAFMEYQAEITLRSLPPYLEARRNAGFAQPYVHWKHPDFADARTGRETQ